MSGSGSESGSDSDTSSRYTLLLDAYFCTICFYRAFGYFHHDFIDVFYSCFVALLCSDSSGSESSESDSEKDVKSKTKKSKKSKVYRIVSVIEIASVTLSDEVKLFMCSFCTYSVMPLKL